DDIINVATAAGDGEIQSGNAGDGALDQRAGLEQVEVGVAMGLVAQLARAHFDEAASQVAVAGAEVSRDEVDRFQEVRVHGAGDGGKVEEQRDRLAVEVHERVARLAAADDEEAAADRAGARDAGEILDHLQGVALRARDALGFFAAEDGPGDLRALPLAFDGRFEGAAVERLQPVFDLQLLAARDRLARGEALVAGGGDDDVDRLGLGEAAKLEAAVVV